MRLALRRCPARVPDAHAARTGFEPARWPRAVLARMVSRAVRSTQRDTRLPWNWRQPGTPDAAA